MARRRLLLLSAILAAALLLALPDLGDRAGPPGPPAAPEAPGPAPETAPPPPLPDAAGAPGSPPPDGGVTPDLRGAVPDDETEAVVREAEHGGEIRPGDIVVDPSLAGGSMRLSVRDPSGGGGSSLTVTEGCSVGFRESRPGPREVEVAVVKDGVLVRAKGTLVLGKEPGRLSEPLRLEPGAGVRARVVDAGGEPVPHARVAVLRPEELPWGTFPVTPGPGGWITYADLEPGVDHRLLVFGLPEPIERTVRVPPEPRGIAEEEIRLPTRLVPVTLEFVREGEPPAPDEVLLATSSRDHRIPVPDRMIPGRYEFRSGKLSGAVTVPPVDGFAATVTLRPPD